MKPLKYDQIRSSTISVRICSPCLWSELPFHDYCIRRDIFAPTVNKAEARSPYLSQKLNFQWSALKIAHINVNRLLLSKLLDIKVLLSLLKFDILAITESHLNQSISKNEIGTAGYKIARCSGNNGCKGGGSIIDFVKHLDAYMNIWTWTQTEAAWIDITVSSEKLWISSIYHPPENTLFLSNFSSTIHGIWMKRANTILLGDFI